MHRQTENYNEDEHTRRFRELATLIVCFVVFWVFLVLGSAILGVLAGVVSGVAAVCVALGTFWFIYGRRED